MQFEVTAEYLDTLREAIQKNDVRFLTKQVNDLYPADIAEILNQLDLDEEIGRAHV